MKKLLIIAALLALSACSPTRVMVRDCQDMKDTPWKNCELIQKL